MEEQIMGEIMGALEDAAGAYCRAFGVERLWGTHLSGLYYFVVRGAQTVMLAQVHEGKVEVGQLEGIRPITALRLILVALGMEEEASPQRATEIKVRVRKRRVAKKDDTEGGDE